MAGVKNKVCVGLFWLAASAASIFPVHADASKSGSTALGPKGIAMPLAYKAICTQPDEMTLAAIVPVATDHGSHASGIVFDNNSVLTAAHAVQGGGHFFVRIGDAFRSADLVMVDHVNDLAVLAVDTAWIVPLGISAFRPGFSDKVWAVGYPRGHSKTTSVGVFKEASDGSLYTSASIDSGQSGGGLLSCTQGRWSLVGMLRGYGAYLQGDHYVRLENHSVSVAGNTITEFLRNYH